MSNTLYRFVDMPELPKEIGEYLVEYNNGKVEKIGYYPFPKKYFYYGTDNVNHLIKRWLCKVEADQQRAIDHIEGLIDDYSDEKISMTNLLDDIYEKYTLIPKQ